MQLSQGQGARARAAGVPDVHLRAWKALIVAHASVVERAEAALAEAGLPPLAWYDVLWALRSSPGSRLRMGELAEHVTISRGGLTRLTDRIESAGLLRRELCATDRRGFDAVLTPDGKAMLRRMWPVYAGALRESIVDRLSQADATVLARTLEKLPPS